MRNSWLTGVLVFQTIVVSLLMISPVTTGISDPNQDEWVLELQANATEVDIGNNISSVQIIAELRDSESNLVDESGIMAEFRTNTSSFIENDDDNVMIEFVGGVASVHLKKISVPEIARIRVDVDDDESNLRKFIYIHFQEQNPSTQTTDQSPQTTDPSTPITSEPSQTNRSASILGIEIPTKALISLFANALLILSIPLLLVVSLPKLLSQRKNRNNMSLNLSNKLQKLFIGLLAAISYRRWWGRINEHDLHNNTYRTQILDILSSEEIVHLRKLQRTLRCSMSTFLWHMDVLEAYGLVKSVKFGQYVAYYLKTKTPSTEIQHTYFALLNQKSRMILQALNQTSGNTIRELQIKTSFGKSNLRYHLKKLIKLGVLEKNKQGKVLYYRITPQYKELVANKLNSFYQVQTYDFADSA